jgi:hypothetical protein
MFTGVPYSIRATSNVYNSGTRAGYTLGYVCKRF